MRKHYITKTHNAKGNKHPGIYSKHKDILPKPKTSHIHVNVDMRYICAIQERYPELTLYKAVQQFIMDSIQPIDPKEIK